MFVGARVVVKVFGWGFRWLLLLERPAGVRRPDLPGCSIPSRSPQRLLSCIKPRVSSVKPCVIVKVTLGANSSTLMDFYKFAEDPFESLKLC